MDDLAEARRELENAQTANTGLRVELHVKTAELEAAQVALATLVRRMAITQTEHMTALARLQHQLGVERAGLADVRRDLADLKRRMGGG
jgi:chromosome segregation ATPase